MLEWIDRDLPELEGRRPEAEANLRAPPRAAMVKEDPGTRLYRLRLPDAAAAPGLEVLLKVYSYDGWFLALRARLGTSRARREFEVLRELARRDIPSLEPIAFGEVDRGALRLESSLVTRFVDGAWMLEDLVPLTPDPRARGAALEAVARAVAAMHARGFFHGTLFPRNILLPGEGADFEGPLIFDAPFGRFHPGEVPDAARAADLACLYRFRDRRLTRGEIARFFRAYLGRAPGTGWGAAGRRLIRAVLRSSAFTRSYRRKARFWLANLFGVPGPVH